MVIIPGMITAETFDHIGGHPLIDFVNTKMMPEGRPLEQLTSNEAVVAWIIDVGMIETDSVKFSVADDPDLLHQALEFRQKMRDMLAAIVAEQPVAAETIGVINARLVHWQGQPQLVNVEDTYMRHIDHELTQPKQLIAMLADEAAQFLADEDLQNVKQCHSATCIRYFLDTSKNHSRRWCSMEGCGNRNKARAHYVRKKGE